jgi:hypothetical protein
MSCDPYFSQVGLLIPADTLTGSPYDAVDVSLNAYGLYGPLNAAAIVIGGGPFGQDCLSLNSPSYGVSSPIIVASGPLDISTGDFTVEGWFQLTNTGTIQQLISIFDSTFTSQIDINVRLGGQLSVILQQAPFNLTGVSNIFNDLAWHFVQFNMQAGSFTIYADGVAVSGIPTTAITLPSLVGGGVTVGSSNYNGGSQLTGNFSDFRLTKGTARAFTLPLEPFPTMACGGTTTVPDLTNTSVSVAAPASLAAASLVLGAISYATNGVIINGNIITQSPAPGTTVVIGSAVDVVISSGLPTLIVPDLFGLTQSEAIVLLLSLGLVPGAIGSAPSQFVPPNLVQVQNPTAGAPVAVGTIVSFVLSLGVPAVGTTFDFEATVISQYANSPTILQLCDNLNEYVDQSTNFANFYNYVWNVDTAVGFGLDIWGVIVGVSRLLNVPTGVPYVGFYMPSESQPDQDWTPAGSSQPPYNDPPVGGAMYTGYNATTAYLLPDDAYRQLILAKAFANICTTTAPAINQILQNLYGPGTAFVLNTGPMAISYNLTFTPTAIQLAILEQSGVIPTPPGVSVTINTNV